MITEKIMNMNGMTNGCTDQMTGRYDKEAYLEKVRSHFSNFVDETQMGFISGPNEIKFTLRNVAYYGVFMEAYYDCVMKNW